MISDIGGPIASSTSFYYNFGSADNFVPTNSFGPGPDAVSGLVQGWKPDHLFAVGDLAYNVGSSTAMDASVGLYYNNFIYPYPSPAYKQPPYLTIGGQPVAQGQRQWPYNIYNNPQGFPNPVDGLTGGSPGGSNRFWASLGNHDYGLEVGYAQTGVTPYSFGGQDIGTPVGPTSNTSLRSSVDYLIPFLEDPSLLGADRNRLNVGAVDKDGNRGVYYSIALGGGVEAPLVEVFQLDSERLNVNAGYEDWNPASLGGQKQYNEGANPPYTDKVKRNPNLGYDPTNPASVAMAETTTDPDNGYDQYRWLLTSLQASKAKWKIITAHHPVYASGRWSDDQPDDHMSNPYLQRLLKALPAGSFDAFYNGHDHFYERILEGQSGGIGLGVPFITNGNAGRNLERKMQIPYGQSIYDPPASGYDYRKKDNPNNKALAGGDLLPSNPLLAGSSGLAGASKPTDPRFNNGLYGYGFGAVKVDLSDTHMLFNYQEARVVDPAIANHLAGGIAPEEGFRSTTSDDWIPYPNASTINAQADIARFKLSVTNGVVTAVTLVSPGNGYMSSKGGDFVVKGFNIYGNNVDLKQPWKNTAQVDLTFQGGRLTAVDLVDQGQGYELAVMSAAESNTATSTSSFPPNEPKRDLIVPINFNLDESQYWVRDPQLYNDWYMIADSTASVNLYGTPGAPGFLTVQMQAKGSDTQSLLSGGLAPTTGYSGSGPQSFSAKAQLGAFSLTDRGKQIASGVLTNGLWVGYVPLLPTAPQDLGFRFDGDPSSSYNVNFKAATGTTPTQFERLSRQSRAAYKQQSAANAPVSFDPVASTALLSQDAFATSSPLASLLMGPNPL
jgi:hypothetical protein